jgi:hypothetical protein
MLLILCFGSTVFSQVHSSERRQVDTVSKLFYQSPRYMIVQSTLATKATFKLDTYTGNVYQLEVDTAGKNIWALLRRLTGTTIDTIYPNANNYNLFVSMLAIRYTYLINVNTGATWQWAVDPKTNEAFFAPMDDHF